ncbi:hypothetical protein NM208_g8796 [Fusarium decemcellulare]|uniref:Uncharacterized protein n=1 Tax=Fusarium decemcellulare TaxID=57161 RepID=A0ACC1S3Z3_9HYPO|nr:hypothetical protein NM208_g8796 [Fusarium decemcellulare]
MRNSNLCEKCQVWNNIEAYKDWWEYNSDSFVTLDEILGNAQCMICEAAATAVNARLQKAEIPVTRRIRVRNDGPFFLDYDTGDLKDASRHRIDSSDPKESVVRLLMKLEVIVDPDYPTVPTKDELERTNFSMTPQYCLRYSTSNINPHLKSVEPWEIPLFDPGLVKKWILGCTKLHGVECKRNMQTKTADLPPGFRVINLTTMNVVEPTSEVTYVALSYMWPPEKESERVQLENKNLDILEKQAGLENIALPPIITDAMLLCKQLGETYLWIDRFCIIQDDPKSKHSQIRGMDKIYRLASFTIIAALNDKEGRGLPGLTGRPRQPSIYKPERALDVELRGLNRQQGLGSADTSLWNGRGWTFQERVLSTRRLYITDHQVLYECCLGHASEELAYYPPHRNAFSSLSAPEDKGPETEFEEIPGFCRWPKYGRGINYHITDSTSILDYLDWVANYTSRQLSFGSDILNAFSGIGNSLSEVLGSSFIFGLPEKYMLQALMWNISDNTELRTIEPGIPSWSWASSPKRADYTWLADRKQDSLNVVSLVNFHYQDPNKGLRKLDVQEWWVDKDVPLEAFRSMEEVPEITELSTKHMPGSARNHLTWKECPHNPWQTLQHSTLDPEACKMASTLPGSLVFNTTVAKLKLRRHSIQSQVMTQGGTEEDLEILDRDGRPIGIIKSTFSQNASGQAVENKEHDIIVICGALADYGTRKWWAAVPWFDFDQWRLHVMLVEKEVSGPFVARRMGVGYIRAHLWKFCAPKWETIVLH